MPQTNSLRVEVAPLGDAEPVDFENVHYISFVSSPGGSNAGTYGVPPIISEESYKKQGLPLRVLYVNPANIAAVFVERTA